MQCAPVLRGALTCEGVQVVSDQLTVAEFPQIAAHVEGFRAAIPPAPGQVDTRPVITGPAMLGAEDTVPHTMEVGGPGS